MTKGLRNKPWPDIFLHAASIHGVRPEACVVVKDIATGVTAAVVDGMTVLGYPALTPGA